MSACLFSITVTYMLAARGGLQVEVYWSARQHGDGSNFRLDSNSLTVMPSLFVKNRIPAFVFYGLISKRSLGCQRQSLRRSDLKAEYLLSFRMSVRSGNASFNPHEPALS